MAKNIKYGDVVYVGIFCGRNAGEVRQQLCNGYREKNGKPQWHTDFELDPELSKEAGWLDEDEIFTTPEEATAALNEWFIKCWENHISRFRDEVKDLEERITQRTASISRIRSGKSNAKDEINRLFGRG